MSSNDAIDRFNKYKSRMDDAATQVIRKFLHLVRPTEGFPASSPYEIQRSYNEWKEEEECFYRMTSSDLPPQSIFPKPPAADAPRSCWRMWGLLIQQQVEHIDQSELISNCVTDIISSPPCRQADCPCKVSTNPWTTYHEVAALGVLNVAHNSRCQCLGYQRCVKKEELAAMASAAREASIKATKAESGGFPYEFCHCGDTQYRACTCGKPAKEAVEYAKKLDAQGKLTPALAEVLCGKGWTKAPREDEAKAKGSANEAKQKAHAPNCACGVCFWEREAKEGRYPPESSSRPVVSSGATSPIGAMLKAAQKADAVIAKTLASSSGGSDMVKDIFASMGAPFDSKCPHGLPFYACMPCSH
jgi:hypothetical protein